MWISEFLIRNNKVLSDVHVNDLHQHRRIRMKWERKQSLIDVQSALGRPSTQDVVPGGSGRESAPGGCNDHSDL